MYYTTYCNQTEEYDAFSSHVRRLNSVYNEDKFHVLLKSMSSMEIPPELYQGRFLPVDELQTKSGALQLSKTRRNAKYNTVFGFYDELLKCKIVTRTPDCIFNGIQEIFVTFHPLKVFLCQRDWRGKWKFCKYLGERHAFFTLNKETKRLKFYHLCLKIDPRNVSIHAKKCQCKDCVKITQ